jgi:hypothetical protein
MKIHEWFEGKIENKNYSLRFILGCCPPLSDSTSFEINLHPKLKSKDPQLRI